MCGTTFPPPHFNARFYKSTDVVVSISKVTHQIVSAVAPDVENHYLPHAVHTEPFYKFKTDEDLARKEVIKQRILDSTINHKNPDKKIFFWNNRNARRKQSGTLDLVV